MQADVAARRRALELVTRLSAAPRVTRRDSDVPRGAGNTTMVKIAHLALACLAAKCAADDDDTDIIKAKKAWREAYGTDGPDTCDLFAPEHKARRARSSPFLILPIY